MLTRFVRTQLIIFTIASIVGVGVMLFAYMQVPTLLGVGRLNVKLELPAAGGLYQFSNVTYRGVQIGRVTDVRLTENGAEADLSLDTSPDIPVDLDAHVLSVSAVGEQYVDLQPKTDSGPFLQNGSKIPASRTTIPQQVGPMLDQLNSTFSVFGNSWHHVPFGEELFHQHYINQVIFGNKNTQSIYAITALQLRLFTFCTPVIFFCGYRDLHVKRELRALVNLAGYIHFQAL